MLLSLPIEYTSNGTTTAIDGSSGLVIIPLPIEDDYTKWKKAFSNEMGRKITEKIMNDRRPVINKLPKVGRYAPQNCGKQDRHGFRRRNT